MAIKLLAMRCVRGRVRQRLTRRPLQARSSQQIDEMRRWPRAAKGVAAFVLWGNGASNIDSRRRRVTGGKEEGRNKSRVKEGKGKGGSVKDRRGSGIDVQRSPVSVLPLLLW